MFFSKNNSTKSTLPVSGQLSKMDLIYEHRSKNLQIYPMDENNLNNASYDISPTVLAMSSRLGMLEMVYKKQSNQVSSEYYITVKPKDTVLIISREYISVPENISGYVTSRVSNVVKGFGHISTTIDPNWKGAVLIALSNPSKIPLKINVSNLNSYPLATVTFHYLNTPCKINELKQKNMRVDLLENEICYKNRKGFKIWINSKIHYKRRRFTDFFFSYLNQYGDKLQPEKGWDEFLNEFSNLENYKFKSKKHTIDFVIKENIIHRILIYIKSHREELIFILIAVIMIVLFILYKFGIITSDEMQAFKPM